MVKVLHGVFLLRSGSRTEAIAKLEQAAVLDSGDANIDYNLGLAYFDVGQFYWAQATTWADPQARVWDGAAGVLIPEERAVDIDTPEDWARAEQMRARLAQ